MFNRFKNEQMIRMVGRWRGWVAMGKGKNTIIAVLLFAGLVLAACARSEVNPSKLEPAGELQATEELETVEEPRGVESLEATEIREYQGENLSSISDFRENSIAGPQYISLDNYRLEITGLVENPLALTYDQVLDRQQYKKVVTLYCVEGWDATILWEGVLLEDLLEQAGIGDDAVIAIFHAADGYTSSLTLDYIRQNDIMLAYKMNGVTLPPERGFPFQVVAESKWGYKWVKWVTKIELSDDADYRGYWESAGYSNNGSINGPIYER